MVLVAGLGFADNGYGYVIDTLDNTVFPYLSPVQEQRNVIFNAFGFQMLLFGGINGTASVAVKALSYLAMTAVLVGALMIIFNPKHRKVSTIAPWLLLVIITVFAPYGSKLLFTPLAKTVKYGIGGDNQTVTSCMDTPAACGFAPQVLGIHIASLLQLTFSDLFNSHQWKGLIQQSNSMQNLYSDPKMVASPEWVARVKDYSHNCGPVYDWNTVINYRLNDKKATNVPDRFVPQTMLSEWEKFKAPYLATDTGRFQIYPPRAIRLYDESDYPGLKASDEFVKNSWIANQRKYEDGLTKLYNIVVNESDKKRVVVGTPKEADEIPASVALAKMQKFSFFDAFYGFETGALQCTINNRCGMMPGFVFIWKGADNGSEAAFYRACYNAGVDGLDSNYLKVACNGRMPQDQAESFRKFLNNEGVRYLGGYESDENSMLGGSVASGTPWEGLVTKEVMSDPVFRDMPVGVISYAMADPTNGSSEKAQVVGDEPMMSCLAEGDRLMNEATSWTLGNAGKAKQLEKLRVLLAGKAVPEKDANDLTTLTLSKIYDAENTCEGKVCPYVSDEPLANNFIKAYESAEGDMESSVGTKLDDSQRWAALIRMAMNAIQTATTTNGRQTEAEGVATKNATEVTLVGNETLTAIGGWGAVFFGKILTGIGAWITGPLSAAIVYFLSLLVDMSLLILIVLTPIMFVIALAMPGAALGVMTIAVMGAFILKTVPITLLVLNNIGGMIYTMIGAGGGENSAVMQNLMILAMAGLYANIVGMTFFLLFKLGDPATVLSRMTALDGSAKQISERGMAAAIAAASAAGLAVGGAIGGTAGALLGAKGSGQGGVAGLREEAVRKLGLSRAALGGNDDNMTPEQKAALEARQKAEKEAAAAGGGGDDLTAQKKAEERAKLVDTNGQAFSGAELDKLDDGTTPKLIENFKTATGASDEEAFTLGLKGQVTTADGKMYEKFDNNGKADYRYTGQGSPSALGETAGAGKPAAIPGGDTEPMDEAARMLQETQQAADRKEQQAQQPQARPGPSQDAIEAQRAQMRGGTLGATAGDPSKQQVDETQKPQMRQQGIGNEVKPAAVAGETDGAAGDARVAGATPGVQDVRLVASEVELAKAQGMEVTQAERLESKKQESFTDKQLAAQDKMLAIANSKDPELKQEVKDAARKAADDIGNLMDVNDPAAIAAIEKDMANTMMEHGTNEMKLKKADDLRRNLAQEAAALRLDHKTKHAADYVEIDRKLKNNETLTAGEKLIKDERDNLNAFDPVMAKEAQLAQYGEAMSLMRKSMDINTKADANPNVFMSALSGFYGGIAGAGGGLARVPVVGTAITEAFNEFYQAPERARAIRSQGGIGTWWSNQGDAQRMGFYQKEMAPLGAATQYQAMGSAGGFQAQADLARQAANEAVARSQSHYNAMLADKQAKFVAGSNLQGEALASALENYFNSASFKANLSIEDLQGLGSLDAAGRVASVRQEAYQAQGKSLKVKSVTLDDAGKLIGSTKMEDVDIQMTADVLNKIIGDNTNKKFASNIDDMMVTHYGLVEKQYLRGNVKWDATRDMTTSGAAASIFATQDVDTDYAVGGHLKMVEGKVKFKDMQGQYHKLVEMRHAENQLKHEEIVKMIGQAGGYQAALQKNNYDFMKEAGMSAQQISIARRDALEKVAKVQLQAQKTPLVLEAIFDESYITGLKKYEDKSIMAPLNLSVQNAKILGNAQKAIVDNMKQNDKFSESAKAASSLYLNVNHPTIPGKTVRVRVPDVEKKFAEMTSKVLKGNLEHAGLLNDALAEDISDIVLYQGANGNEYGHGISEADYNKLIGRFTGAMKANIEKSFLDQIDVNGNKLKLFSKIESDGTKLIVDGKV